MVGKKVKIIDGLPYHLLLRHPAAAYLQGALKEALPDWEVSAGDYTVEAFRYLINESERVKEANKDGSLNKTIEDANFFLDNLGNLDFLKDYKNYKEKKEAAEKVASAISLPGGEELRFSGNTFKYLPKDEFTFMSREGIVNGIERPEENLFHGYFQRLSGELAKEKYDVVGFSVSDHTILIPTLILSGLIKEKSPRTKIVIGGDFISRVNESFTKNDETNKKLLQNVDAIVYGEGENVLPELVRRLGDGKSLDGLQKTIFLKDGEVVHNEIGPGVRMGSVATPDFRGLYNQSILPEPVLALQSARGCGNTDECGFCAIGETIDELLKSPEGNVYKRMVADKFADQILKVSEEMKTHTFSFTDLTFYPAVIKQTFDALEKKRPGFKIQWDCYAQVAKEFTDREFTDYLAEKGCRFMQFGVEATSEHTLDNMDKAKSARAEEVLKTTFSSGIWNHAFFISGFPGSSVGDDLNALAFLEENGQYILTIRPNVFKLSRRSPAAREPEKYGLIVKETGDLETNLQFNYGNTGTYQSHNLSKALGRTIERWVKRKHGVAVGETLERFGRGHYTQKELEVLEGLKAEKAPINEVARTYVYHQRYFLPFEAPYVFALKEFAVNVEKHRSVNAYCGELHRKSEAEYRKGETEVEDVKLIWNALVGKQLPKLHGKLEKASGEKYKELMGMYTKLAKEDPAAEQIVKAYPGGFNGLDDVVGAAKLIAKG